MLTQAAHLTYVYEQDKQNVSKTAVTRTSRAPRKVSRHAASAAPRRVLTASSFQAGLAKLTIFSASMLNLEASSPGASPLMLASERLLLASLAYGPMLRKPPPKNGMVALEYAWAYI